MVFSVLMVAAPLGSLYACWNGALDSLLLPLLGPKLEEQRPVVAGALGVLAVQAVLVGFVAAAWLEKPPASKGSKAE